jgi:hypothetical protein
VPTAPVPGHLIVKLGASQRVGRVRTLWREEIGNLFQRNVALGKGAMEVGVERAPPMARLVDDVDLEAFLQ